MTLPFLQFLLAFAESSHLGDDPNCDILQAWKHLSRFLNSYEGNGPSSLSWEAGGAEAGRAAGEHYLVMDCLIVGWDEYPKRPTATLPSPPRPSPAQFQQHQTPSIGWGSR